MNTHELLIAARKKIERPECWTKGQLARDMYGEQVPMSDVAACCWCGYGAIWSEAREWSRALPEAEEALDMACGSHFPTWQDAPERTHAEVMKVFDIAIEKTRGEG